MGNQRTRDKQQQQQDAQQQQSPLKTERGNTYISDSVVSEVVGIAAQEVEGVQMGGGTSQAVGGFVDSVTGSSGNTRGVSVEVGEEEAAADLTMVVEYGKSIPQLSEAVRTNVTNRVENLVGLKVTEVNITVADVQFPEERPQLEEQRELQQQARQQEQRA